MRPLSSHTIERVLSIVCRGGSDRLSRSRARGVASRPCQSNPRPLPFHFCPCEVFGGTTKLLIRPHGQKNRRALHGCNAACHMIGLGPPTFFPLLHSQHNSPMSYLWLRSSVSLSLTFVIFLTLLAVIFLSDSVACHSLVGVGGVTIPRFLYRWLLFGCF